MGTLSGNLTKFEIDLKVELKVEVCEIVNEFKTASASEGFPSCLFWVNI